MTDMKADYDYAFTREPMPDGLVRVGLGDTSFVTTRADAQVLKDIYDAEREQAAADAAQTFNG